jgi:hypothetical protein
MLRLPIMYGKEGLGALGGALGGHELRLARTARLANAAVSRGKRNSTCRGLLFARDGVFWLRVVPRTNPMNVVLMAIGCILFALGLVMLANRSGYVYFVVGPGSVLVIAGVVGMLAFWILQAAK